jgi:hypothetical protein
MSSTSTTGSVSLPEKSIQANVPVDLLLPEKVLALYPGFPVNLHPSPSVALIPH